MATLRRRSLSAGILKAMGIFSGVQVLNILCAIVRTKFVALWIGPVGVGLFGLYNSAIDTLSTLSQLGIRNSAVRDISASQSRHSHVARVATVVRRWAFLLGIVGAFLTLILSPALSRLTFGDDSHIMGFVILASAVFFSSITAGELALLQGLRRLRRLANASIVGAIAALLISLPLYYYWGIDSIAPSIVVYAAVTLIATLLYRERLPKADPTPTPSETLREGAGFIRLGIFMTASAFITLALNYLFMAYLNASADTDTVGYYQAGYTLVNRYIGLVFTAIAMEYYPRLTASASSRLRTNIFVSHESAMALYVILPVAIAFMCVDDLVIRLLYSGSFTVVAPMVTLALVGTVLRALSWCIAFVILARGDGKAYLLTESISALVALVLNVVAYRIGGLTALGAAYIGWYLIYLATVWIVCRRRYNFSLSKPTSRLALLTLLLCIAASAIRLLPTLVDIPTIVGIDATRFLLGIIAGATAIFSFRRLRALTSHR